LCAPPSPRFAADVCTEDLEPVLKLLKKYPNRRIYDTSTSRFITVDDVRQMVLNYEPFEVVDTKTGENLTRSTLLQIITDMEGNGRDSPLTNKVLEELIRFYGDSATTVVSGYLEQVICTLLEQRNSITGKVKQVFNAAPAIPIVSDLTKQYTKFWKSVLTPTSSTGNNTASNSSPNTANSNDKTDQ
jgi:polyhydroxyalkanoate synthesis repressor PhaR